MEKHLLTEISRVKEIMGLSLLSEGIDDLVKKLLGVSDESAESIAKSADEIGSELSTALKQIVGGTGTYDDLVSYVARTKGGSTFDDIITFVKSQPELLKKIATSSDIIMKNAAQEIIKKSNVTDLLTKTTIDVVDDLLNLNIRSNNTDSIIPMIDSAITTLKPYSWNSDIDELITKLEDRKSIAKNLKSGLSSSKISNQIDNVVGNSSINIEDLKDDRIENLINKIKTDPNFEKLNKGFWNKIKGREQKFLDWVKLDLKCKTIGDLNSPQTEQKIKIELDRRIEILKTSSKTSEREAGTKLENISKRLQSIKTIIKSLPGGSGVWATLSAISLFWAVSSTVATINNMSEGDPFMKALESYGIPDAVKDVKDIIYGKSGNNEESLTDDFNSFKIYFEKLKEESPDWSKWSPNDKNSEGFYTLTANVNGVPYTYKYGFENNQFVYKGE
jgi:hypothetical protein